VTRLTFTDGGDDGRRSVIEKQVEQLILESSNRRVWVPEGKHEKGRQVKKGE
jgi:hypothetical protein